jgi:hypothetical protein
MRKTLCLGAALSASLVATGVALAASGGALKPKALYQYTGSAIDISFVTHSATQIHQGAPGVAGSQYPLSGVFVRCASGRSADAGLPPSRGSQYLVLSHNSFKSVFVAPVAVPGAGQVVLRVNLTGHATRSAITGTVKVTGSGCTHSASYKAKLTSTKVSPLA